MLRGNLESVGLKKSHFHGIFRGVIEDNNDPEKLGRVRVRIWGIHTDDLRDSPVANLPWAEPCLGLVEGSISGFGAFSVPLQGSHVFCFFEGGNWEALRYFATVPGRPETTSNTSLGFSDPSGVYPLSSKINESDFHRLARAESIDQTIVQHKNDNLDLGVIKSDESTWDEPPSAYAAEYPHNIVLTTHRGLVVELDNTVGAERIHVFHPSNTYIEIDKDGNVVFRNEGNRFEITRGTRNKHILVDDNETIEGDKTSRVGFDETIHVGKDRKDTVVNNRETIIGVNDTKSVGKDLKNITGNDKKTSVGRDVEEAVGRDWTIACGGNVTISAKGTMTLVAPRIDLNPGIAPYSGALEAVVPAVNIQSGVDPTEVLITQFFEDDTTDISGTPGLVRSFMDDPTKEVFTSMGINPESNPEYTPQETNEDAPTNTPAEIPADCSDITADGGGNILVGYDFQLSTRFKLRHVTTTCAISNYQVISQVGLTEQQIACNLRKLCVNLLEPISDRYGVPVINSGFRHGSGSSWHNKGSAADIQWPGISDDEYYNRLVWIKDNLRWCELILEYGGNRPWLHVAYNDTGNNLTNFKTRVAVANGYQRGILKLRNIPKVGGV